MSARRGGVLLVALALAAPFGAALQVLFVVASVVWLLTLRRQASARWVFAVALLIRVPFLGADYFSDDLHRYVWEGRIQHAGFSPYAHPPEDPALARLRGPDHDRINHPELTTVYPPLSQSLFFGATGVGLRERGLRAVIVLLDVAVVGVLLRWLAATHRPSGWAIAYAWCPLAAASAGTGHVDPLMLLCLAGTGWAWETGRPWRAAALLAGAVLAKTTAVLLLPWLFLRRPRAALLAVAVVAAGCLPYLGPGLLDGLLAFGSGFAFNGSLHALAARAWPGAALPIVAAVLLAWTAAVAASQPRFAVAAVLVFAGLLLCSPTVHFWYLTWFLVALPAVGPRRWTVPLLCWAATAVFASETYHASYRNGAPFAELWAMTVLEYAIPLAVALWLAWRAWPRPVPPDPPCTGPAPGAYAVVLPCRGEARNLERLLPRWLATDAVRVVVADTPTGDGTRELVARLGDPRLAYAEVAERGYGAAVLAGMRAAGTPAFVVVCDADHGRGPEQVGALLAPFVDPAVGLVTAARADGRGQSLAQRAGNALVTLLVALGWGRRFADLGPFRALRRASWPEGALRDRGFGFNVEMNVRALERGMQVREVALPGSERRFGRSRIGGSVRGVARAGAGILFRLWRLREEACGQPSSS